MSYASSYHDQVKPITHQSDPRPDIRSLEQINNKQDRYVLKIFLANHKRGFTSGEISNWLLDEKMYILSGMPLKDALARAMTIDKCARRSVTNLCEKEKYKYLIRTEERRESPLTGVDNYVYELSARGRLLIKLLDK